MLGVGLHVGMRRRRLGAVIQAALDGIDNINCALALHRIVSSFDDACLRVRREYPDITGNTMIGSDTIRNVSSTADCQFGMRINGPDIPADSLIQSFDADSITINGNATGIGLGETFVLGNEANEFGFLPNGDLDVAAILAFTGQTPGAAGRTVNWYQQLAAAASVMSDLTQTVATLQPYIVQAGAIVTDPDTGKPAIRQPTSGAGAEYVTATSWVTRPTDAAEIFVGLMTPESRRECISSTISAGVYAGFAENGSSGGVAVASGAPTYYVNRAPISAQTRQALYDAVVPTGQKIVTGEELSFSSSEWDDYRTEFTQQTGVDGPEYQSCRIILDAPTAGQISQVESRLAAHYGITLP